MPTKAESERSCSSVSISRDDWESRVTEKEATLAIINALDAQEIPYILVVSFSTSFYGIPRLTQDADFVISIGDGSLAKFAQDLGPEFRVDPQMSFETVTMTRRTEIRVIDSP